MAYSKNRKYTYQERENLPDSAFLLPKYRKLPFKQVQGGKLKISLSHVRNALARANQVQGVPRNEVEAAVRRARMILASHGGYAHSEPTPIAYPSRLAANRGGLSETEAEDVVEYLLEKGIESGDIEAVPISRTSRKVCLLFWTGTDWGEIYALEDVEEVMVYTSNRNKAHRQASLTRGEASDLARELEGDFEPVVVKRGSGYAVEIVDAAGYPTYITSLEDLRFVANRGKKKPAKARVLTRAEAQELARELEGDFDAVVVRRGKAYAVEITDHAGWPVYVTSMSDLRYVANRGRRGASKGLTAAEARTLARDLEGDYEAAVVRRKGAYAVEIIDNAGWPVYVTSHEDLRYVANRG